MKKITGGKNGYKTALNEAFYGRGRQMHSPAVKYSHARGFHVEPASELCPADSDVLFECRANFHANSGKMAVPSYNDAVEAILCGEPEPV